MIDAADPASASAVVPLDNWVAACAARRKGKFAMSISAENSASDPGTLNAAFGSLKKLE
ncbi:hypothetical protein [Janthinobacterium sp. 17J80-10]|uniref:hypothetical protein n=1 Tax=Janthinobacterium sp. 17J80-10 TaxID=2497863 RepID=UPI0013E8B600|nr:hypothetical protein [Janthinobacterium sp. 17J80-10]